MFEEPCGYCLSRGQIDGPAYDRDGRAVEVRSEICEYCGGRGCCVGGAMLLPALTAAQRLERAGLTLDEHARDLGRTS